MACLDPAPVIFSGADTPDLALHHTLAAIAALSHHDVVIGPAEDGGGYLVGMPWSTERMLPETLARMGQRGSAPVLLETLADCDRPAGLARWPRPAA